MIQRNPKSIGMFTQDVESTYARIASRTIELIAEEKASGGDGSGNEEREQIQLYAEDPNMQISFNLPDGPPPAELRVEGEGAEDLDIEQVRAFLQRKWEIFQGFDEKLRKAMQSEKLDEVNKVLGRMKVKEAEDVVELMQEGGMLSFR
jgi:cell division cycle protein 37